MCHGVSRCARVPSQVLDCDKLAHEIYLPGTDCHAALRVAFGESIVTAEGAIDRKALGGLVFGNEVEMKRLCAIAWPATAALAAQRIHESKAPVVVMEAAVLLEAGAPRSIVCMSRSIVSLCLAQLLHGLVKSGIVFFGERVRLASQPPHGPGFV